MLWKTPHKNKTIVITTTAKTTDPRKNKNKTFGDKKKNQNFLRRLTRCALFVTDIISNCVLLLKWCFHRICPAASSDRHVRTRPRGEHKARRPVIYLPSGQKRQQGKAEINTLTISCNRSPRCQKQPTDDTAVKGPPRLIRRPIATSYAVACLQSKP